MSAVPPNNFQTVDHSGLAPDPSSPSTATGAATSSSVTLDADPPVRPRLDAVKSAKNPLLEAAQPLLRALADMSPTLDSEGVEPLRRLLEREVLTFQALCSDAAIRHEHVVAASYALCTALDEAANSTEWGGTKAEGQAGVWASQQLAAQFHGDIKGGDKFFLLVGRLAASPQEHIDLLELMYYVLGLGFRGRYSTATNGHQQLEAIRRRLLTLLNSARGDVPRELSPHWRGEGAGKFRLLRSVPVWVTASLLSLAALGLFAWYKFQLGQMSTDVEQRIAAIGRMHPPPVPVATVKPLRLKELLAAEIARGTVSVEEDERRSAVTFKGDDMFVPGQARLSQKIIPVLGKVADEINQVTGTVQVTGHSDNQPIRTREFPDNQVLSEKRAAAVSTVLQGRGVVASRIQTEGKGDTVPVAQNATPAGRARNRRVDIVVTQGGATTYVATIGAPAGGAVVAPAAPAATPVQPPQPRR
ncbi:type VI secretion system protein TssL, long form [Xenophilus aerolatus]|nr:type VI secretion system protein TssL, long form [Xenophilus aerolatus]